MANLEPLPLPPLGAAPIDDPTKSGAFPHRSLVDHIINALWKDTSQLTPERAKEVEADRAHKRKEASADAAAAANNPAAMAAGYMKAPSLGGGGGDLLKSIGKLFSKGGGIGT